MAYDMTAIARQLQRYFDQFISDEPQATTIEFPDGKTVVVLESTPVTCCRCLTLPHEPPIQYTIGPICMSCYCNDEGIAVCGFCGDVVPPEEAYPSPTTGHEWCASCYEDERIPTP